MSLRRSARLSSSNAHETRPATAAESSVNSTSGARYIRTTAKTTAANSNKKRKATASSPSRPTPVSQEAESPFKTPEPKRRKPASAPNDAPIPPPLTPTPSGVTLLASTPSLQTLHPLEDFADLKPRPTEPHATNAPLATPGGSRVVAYTSSPLKPAVPSQVTETVTSESPSKKKRSKIIVPPDVGGRRLPPTSTVDTLLRDACEHLVKVDERLKGLIEKHHCKIFSPEGLREVVDPFTALASGIIGQQVSGQAAASIRKKFTALFPETHPSFPSPAQVTEKDLQTLRTAGLSQRKAEYIHGLAEKFASGELSAQMLVSASDEELIEKLVAVRGLGRWSVEMFACFGLKRMDVFSTGDLGVQRGMATYVGKDVGKLKAKGGKWKYMTEKEMLDIAAKFSPYRSLFMWYMWRIEDVDVSVLQAN